MLRNMTSLIGLRLHAADGYIGKVRDCLFNHRTWNVQHIVADTMMYLPIHQVLVETNRVEGIDWIEQAVKVRMRKTDVRHSPGIDEAPPLFREMERRRVNFAMWAPHWLPMSGEVEPNPDFMPEDDSGIRSIGYMNGHRVLALDGAAGNLADFIMDDGLWRIRMFVVRTESDGHEREVLIPTEAMVSDSPENRTVSLCLDRAAVSEAPEYTRLTLGRPGLEQSLHEFLEHATHHV